MSETLEAPIDQGELDFNSLPLRLEGFEGPLDLLLELARTQKVDLAKISILALVEQYLAIVEGARRVRLELAADWLVMAAWLTWLKSRLLLPDDTDGAEEGEMAADVLAARLRELQAMRAASLWLGQQPQLGFDIFRRGVAESRTEIDRSRLSADVPGLIRAYLTAVRRGGALVQYRPRPITLWSVKEALRRVAALLGSLPDWASLREFLPANLREPLHIRAALASTLIAGLELAKSGHLELRQDENFGTILVGRARLPLEAAADGMDGDGEASEDGDEPVEDDLDEPREAPE